MDGTNIRTEEIARCCAILERICPSCGDEDALRFCDAVVAETGDIALALLTLLQADGALSEWFRDEGFVNIAKHHMLTFCELAVDGKQVWEIYEYFSRSENSATISLGNGEFGRTLK